VERHGIASHAFTCVHVCNFNWIAALTNNADWVQTALGNCGRKVSNLQTFLLSIHNFTVLLLSVIYVFTAWCNQAPGWHMNIPGFSVKIFRIYFISIFCVDHQKMSVKESLIKSFLPRPWKQVPFFYLFPKFLDVLHFSILRVLHSPPRHLVILLANLLLVDTDRKDQPRTQQLTGRGKTR